MDDYEKYQEAYKNYYKLKKKYDDKLINKKKKLKGKSVEEKKREIAKFLDSRKCINCKQPGGTIFSDTDGILRCVCGASNKCKLNIELKKIQYFNMEDEIHNNNKSIKELKQQIIEYKLDLLFGLEKEEVVLQQFNTLKQQMDELIEISNTLKQNWRNRNDIVVEGEGDDEKEMTMGDFVKENKEKFNQAVNEFKSMIQSYRTEQNEDLLRDAIELYKHTIKPISQLIRNTMYQETYLTIIKNQSGGFGKKLMPIYHLQPQKIIPQNKIIWNTDFKIISNKK